MELTRETDVLDTWYSSALWPFSTLGWPDRTPELDRFYPGDALITAFDIIFFWVARMIMMGMHFMNGEVPFRTVYIHALVRDAHGDKMSKSKGNVIDPLDVIEQYGCDALRFTLAAMAAQGRDIKLAPDRVAGYRNFATKLWNAARFCQMNGCVPTDAFDPAGATGALNRWIVGKVARTAAETGAAIESYRFNEAANAVYQFTWGTFCDWYLELAKPILQGDDDAMADMKAETRATASWVCDQILILLHPFMPFITEELWDSMGTSGTGRTGPLIAHAWPRYRPEDLEDADAAAQIDWAIRVISAIRGVRAEMNVPAGAEVPVHLIGASAADKAALKAQRPMIERLARLSSIDPADAACLADVSRGAIQTVVDDATLFIGVADVIDIAADRARLQKEIAKVAGLVAGTEKRLSSDAFTSKAPEHVVAATRARLEEYENSKAKLESALRRIDAM